MPLPLLLSSLLLLSQTQSEVQGSLRQDQSAPAAPVAALATSPSVLQNAPNVAESVRLALTPKLDGMVSDEEWDPFATVPNMRGYLQWEPGKLYFAAAVPMGNDLLISLDLKSNGWLVGNDNLEVRVSNVDGNPSLRVRQMDATQVNGPRWIELPMVAKASSVAVGSDGTNTIYEVALDDAGLNLLPFEGGDKISVRMDAVTSTTPSFDPFLPRSLAPVTMAFMRSAALPSGLRWNAEGAGNNVVPGENTKIRLTFNGDNKLNLNRLAVRSEGFARLSAAEFAAPFPAFDAKGRAFVDYKTDITKDAGLGYRILRGSLTGGDGVTGILQTSYRIAPLLDVDAVRAPGRSRPQPQIVRLGYYIRSRSLHSMKGTCVVIPPDNFQIEKGGDESFTINGPFGAVRRGIKVTVPAAARGIFPFHFKIQANGKNFDSVQYLNLE